jgi:tRNA 2-thiocytidine biosynthesis protein TtcA
VRFPAWYKRLNRSVGKAICSYDMISEGDRIAVGISGGKDSLVLLSLLKRRMAYVPVRYDLVPIYIDPGFTPSPAPVIEAFCRDMGLTPKIIFTDNGLVAHGPENRENPCFLCARLRRKALFEATLALGCNKLALGHHKDDLIETFFINVLYSGQICTMIPVQHFFQGKFTMIRPLAYSDESHIRIFADKSGLPVVSNPCPSAHISKRSEIKSLLNQLYRTNKKVRGNIFCALHHVNPDFMLSSAPLHLSAPENANHTPAESIDPARIHPPTENFR